MSGDQIAKLAVADTRAIVAAIRVRRIQLGLTLGEIAILIPVALPTYSQWESGAVFPPTRPLARAARAVGLRLTVVDGDAP